MTKLKKSTNFMDQNVKIHKNTYCCIFVENTTQTHVLFIYLLLKD